MDSNVRPNDLCVVPMLNPELEGGISLPGGGDSRDLRPNMVGNRKLSDKRGCLPIWSLREASSSRRRNSFCDMERVREGGR
jgi:hypothetical protein